MTRQTAQMERWSGEFGKNYTERNSLTPEELDASYKSKYCTTRTQLNEQFLGAIDRSIKILEVGSNVGTQLQCLQKMGFHNLYGIELQGYAVERSKNYTKHINIIQGSAFDIPFKDGFFNIVFTSGVLIHISPSNIKAVLNEIYRCSQNYIWGFEYYADAYTEILYRGYEKLLWKTNYAQLYLDNCEGLELVQEERLKYVDSDNIDTMFLLKKGNIPT